MRLLLVGSEQWDQERKRYAPCLVLAPEGYNPDLALHHTILPLPDPYVVAEFEIVAEDPKSMSLLPAYASYSEND